MISISSALREADVICDYIPIISTASNFFDLFLKFVVIPSMTKSAVANSHYYTHLKQKDVFRCVVLLVPFMGNLDIGLHDFAMSQNNNRLLA